MNLKEGCAFTSQDSIVNSKYPYEFFLSFLNDKNTVIGTRINSMNGDSIVHLLFKISSRLAPYTSYNSPK
jgi:hypothetical protein